MGTIEGRILDAVEACWERFGLAKTTIDDIVAESGASRATIYRLFPGGKDVLFDALRVRNLQAFFAVLDAKIAGCDGVEDLLVTTVVAATRELRDDVQLAAMLASEPGEVAAHLTVGGVPRIIRFADALLLPRVTPFVGAEVAHELIDVVARMTISYFLAPSGTVDLGDEATARRVLVPFLRSFLDPTDPALSATITQQETP